MTTKNKIVYNDEHKLDLCPLCNRDMIPGLTVDDHHMIPRSKGGKKIPPVTMHIVCHRKIHSVFTESDLAAYYNTFEHLMEHEKIVSFVKWVGRKPIEYMDSHRESKTRRFNKH